MPLVNQVEGQQGGVALRLAHRPVHGPEVDTRFEQRRGRAVAERRHAACALYEARAVLGGAAGALDAAAMHGCGGGGHGLVSASGGGQEPDRMSVRGPGMASEGSGVWREGDRAVLGALAPMHVDHESLAVDVSNVEQESFVQSESQALDSGEVHTVMQGRGPAEQAPHFLHTEDGWEPVCGWSAHEVEELPVALQNVQGEEADAAGADTHGGWREVSAVCAMQNIVLKLRCGDEVG